MYLVQLLLPATAPDHDPRAFQKTREELASRFGGVTAYSRSPAEGVWTSPEGEQERDSVLMVEVLTDEFDRPWWRSYQSRLASRFAQEEIHVRVIGADVP